MRLYDTMNRQIEEFNPIEPGRVRFYTCGPTVYNYAHVGNLRTYVSEDFVRRALEAAGLEVFHVMNITDVGHLQLDDIEAGEDKMEVAARRERKDPWEIARFYEEEFVSDCEKLNIQAPAVLCRATEHIDRMIDFVLVLEEKGFTYEVDGNVYFSVPRFPEYGRLARLDLTSDEQSRVDVDERKQNSRDFVLWFSQSKYPDQIMKWDSPWGKGFPGWHIECSAMASHYLGDRIDIHMGGIDHVPVHHTNEIAQSEARFGHKWVNYWMHCGFLIIDNAKMAKSDDNFLRLQTLLDQGFEPVHFRYFAATASYRSELKFSWESLTAAREAFESLKNSVVQWKHESTSSSPLSLSEQAVGLASAFWEAAWDDVNMPRCLSVLWGVVRDAGISPAEKLDLLLDFDRLLGFGVDEMRRPALPDDLMSLIKMREEARSERDWELADGLRDQLLEQGIQVKDGRDGTDWYRVYGVVSAVDSP